MVEPLDREHTVASFPTHANSFRTCLRRGHDSSLTEVEMVMSVLGAKKRPGMVSKCYLWLDIWACR